MKVVGFDIHQIQDSKADYLESIDEVLKVSDFVSLHTGGKEAIITAREFKLMEGRPLPDERGAPARVVSPFDLAYKNIKFVTRAEFAAAPTEGWWTRANPIYPVEAPVQQDRLRRPDPRFARKR